MTRIPFGKETRRQIINPFCPDCLQPRGRLHEPGCSIEICQQCGGQLIYCHCRALDPADAALVIEALSYQTDVDDGSDLTDPNRPPGGSYQDAARIAKRLRTLIESGIPSEIEKAEAIMKKVGVHPDGKGGYQKWHDLTGGAA